MAMPPDPKQSPDQPASGAHGSSPKVDRTDAEWRQQLTPEQYRVTRQAGTEHPYGTAYEEFNAHSTGNYHCVCCGARLFSSNEKFHSGCGWPSFYDPAEAENVEERVDTSHGMRRVEVVCRVCDAHLGHVFEGEGYDTPTDRRFCINAAALDHRPAPSGDGS